MLGIPQDAREVISSIYAHASTTILTPYGPTPAIPVTRGTLQGDTLSPLLFLLYLEPLLRWLHQGGRGYTFGCLDQGTTDPSLPLPSPSCTNARHQLGAAAYADDLAAPTTTLQDMEVQADKISSFCTWAHLEVNAAKCAITAGLFYLWDYEPGSKPSTDPRPVNRLQGRILLQGKPIPPLHPSHCYTYLGAPLNLLLDWTPAYLATIKKITDKGKLILANTTLTRAHKLRIVEETITPLADYLMAICPFTLAQLDTIEGKIAHIKRKCLGLPQYYPVHSLMHSHQAGGWGTGTIMQRLVQCTSRTLTHCLNDTGRLGAVTLSLTQKQLQKWKSHPRHHTHELGPIGMTCTSIRQLHFLQLAGISLRKEGAPIPNLPQRHTLHDLLQHTLLASSPPTPPSAPPPQLPHFLQVALHNLWEVGIITPTQLLSPSCQTSSTLIPNLDLHNLLGSTFTNKHRRAVNLLTWCCHNGNISPYPRNDKQWHP